MEEQLYNKGIMQINKKSISFNVDSMTGDCNGWGFWNYVVSNEWEPHTFNILNRFCSKEHSYVDIGAWVGPTVLFGAQLSKQCFAFEPDPHAFASLQTNLKLNPNIINTYAYPVAIGHVNGIVKFGTNSNKGDSMSSLLFADQESWDVESITLRDSFSKYGIENCNFIKMDIEGGESQVLPAAKEFLSEIKPTLYLSLHTAWIQDKTYFLNSIKDVISIYKNIYDNAGKKILLDDIDSLPLFTEILATNEEW